MNRLIRIISTRVRLMVALLGGALAGVLPLGTMRPLARAILAWDVCCVVFLVAIAIMFIKEPMSRIARDAKRDQEGEWTIFWFTIAAVAASFGVIIGEFSQGGGSTAGMRNLHAAVVAGTLLLSWLMTHTLFALRYAHEYYDSPPGTGGIAGGLAFPGDVAPDYWDFFYFAVVVGMTFQVSDVQITARSLRRLAIAHGLIGFLFNTVVLALSVNIGATLMQQ